MELFQYLNDIRSLQGAAMIVSASLAIVMLLIRVPHTEHAKKLTRTKDVVAFSYLICAFIFGYTLWHRTLEDYESFSALTMLIIVAFSSSTLSYSLINLLNYRSNDGNKLLISLFAIFILSIALVNVFFYEKSSLFKGALTTGIVLFCGQCVYYIIIFDKWYKTSIQMLEKYYDEDEEHKLKWVKFCFILAMLTNMFLLVYLILPWNFMIIYIGFYILFLLYFAGNFISFLGSHKLLLDAFGHYTINNLQTKKVRTKAPKKTPAQKKAEENSLIKLESSLQKWVEEKRYKEYDKTREEIASELGTSKELLNQYFINKGLDFRTWRTELRIEEAKKLLLENKKLSTNMIGEMAGFSDRSNFHRQFTRIVGCSPKEYRESGAS